MWNTEAELRSNTHRKHNQKDFDHSLNSQFLISDDFTSPKNTVDFDIDDEDFTSPEISVYKELYEEYKLKFNNLYKRINYHHRIRMSALVGIILIVIFTLQSLVSNKSLESTDSDNKSSHVSNPLEKIIIPGLKSLLPEHEVEESYDVFDFRLSSGLILLYIQNHIVNNKFELGEDFTVPFSWSDWIDLDSRLELDEDYLVDWLSTHSDEFLNELGSIRKLDCKYFATIFGVDSNPDFWRQCEDIESDQSDIYPFRFLPSGPTSAKIKEAGRVLYGAAFLKMKMSPPAKLYLMDVMGSDGEGSIMVNVDNSLIKSNTLRNPTVLKSFIDWYCSFNKIDFKTFINKGWSIKNLKNVFSKTIQKTQIGEIIYQNEHSNIDVDKTYVAIQDPKKDNIMRMSEWKFEDFYWDEESFLNQLSYDASTSSHESLDTKLNENIDTVQQYKLLTGSHPKYLHEAQIYGTTLGSHYDWRFFTSTFISNDHRQSVIHRLSRTWLRFCFENEIKTFIAYGSMLGWIRNGLTLPWDGDIDVIVTMESFHLLARNFNQTLIMDYSDDDDFQSAMTGYFLDLSPTYYSRVKGDGSNVIDGRLIDISTGMYLDITALAWTDKYLDDIKISDKIKKVIDKDHETNKIFAVEGERYDIALMEQLRQLQNDKKLVHCKNDNVYQVDELLKMIPSYFEGVRAYFPHMYEEIIWRLYPKALTRITEPGHVYDDQYNLWVSIYSCPDYVDWFGDPLPTAEFGTCPSADVLQEYRLTKEYTTRHQLMIEDKDFTNLQLMQSEESAPFRIDEFFILYSNLIGMSNEELEQLYKDMNM